MLINSAIDLITSSGSIVKANEPATMPEMMFNTLSLHCNKGSAIITTEYGIRTIQMFGDLNVVESTDCDPETGMKIIVVS